MSRKDRIQKKLSALKPHFLEIINESHLHTHHKESDGSKDSHFKIKIASTELDDLNLIDKHKAINELLKDEFSSGLHALSIRIIKL